MDENMNSAPADMKIPYNESDFPALQGMKEGDTVSFEGKAQIAKNEGEYGDGKDGGMYLHVMHLDVNPEDNAADSELDKMVSGPQPVQAEKSDGIKTKGF